LTVTTGDFHLGYMGDKATFNQSGGKVVVGHGVRMERSNSVYNLSGGTLDIGTGFSANQR